MNKKDLSKEIAERMNIRNGEAQLFLQTLCEIVGNVLLEEKSIVLQNFGTFSLWQQSERPGRNPKNGKPVVIKARNSVKFKPGKGLIDILNKN